MTAVTRQAEQRTLEEAILSADARGDTRQLERLQAEFRSRGYAVNRIYPGSSATLTTRMRSTKAATVAHSRSRLRGEPTLPTVATTPSTMPVVFSADARREIILAPIDTGLERGGWLVGRFADGGLVVETATTVRLPFSPYRTTSCRLPAEDRELWQGHFSAAGWSICGDWHCHPQYLPEGPDASEGDRRGWQSLADTRGHAWLGLIVGPCDRSELNGADWRWPRFCGWLAQPGRTVIDPVHLTPSND